MTPLDRRVAYLARAHPELQPTLELHAALLRAVRALDRQPQVQPFLLPPGRLQRKLGEGTPLLHDEPATLDVGYAASAFSRLLNVLLDQPDQTLAERAAALAEAATAGLLPPDQLFTEAFVQHPDHVSDLALRAGVEPEVLILLASLAVGPLLRAYAERLMPILGSGWRRGYCPICGAWPALAELRGAERERWLRCGDCGADWARSPACVYCGNADPHTYRSLLLDDEPRLRAEVCDVCRGFLKQQLTLEPVPSDLLGLEDLASVALDTAAGEQGYARPTTAGFRIELALPEDELAEELVDLD